MKNVILIVMIAFGLVACGGGSSGGGSSSTTTASAKSDVNVAASSNGATATAVFNASTAANINDEDDTTTWISDPDSPIIINFGSVENIKKITIRKVSASISGGSNPDVLVELSEDGTNYFTSDITMITGGDIGCNSSTFSATLLECTMDERATQYLRVTSKNGLSFEFQEVEVISYK